jgi:hypothetical protein
VSPPYVVLQLDVRDTVSGAVLAQSTIQRSDFSAANTQQWFSIYFTTPAAAANLEYRVYFVCCAAVVHYITTINACGGAPFQRGYTPPLMPHVTGQLIYGSVWQATAANAAAYAQYGPYVTDAPLGTTLTASYLLAIDNNNADTAQVASVDINDFDAGGVLLGSLPIYRNSFAAANAPQWFSIDFTSPAVAGHRLEYRVFSSARAALLIINTRVTQRGGSGPFTCPSFSATPTPSITSTQTASQTGTQTSTASVTASASGSLTASQTGTQVSSEAQPG